MRPRMTHLASLSLAVIAAACSQPDPATSDRAATAPDEAPFVQQTFTYKTVGDKGVEADVYRADDEIVRPVLVWIHGGALIFGSRSNPPRRLLDLARVAGFALVSIDYRLAPDVMVPAIIEDLEDAIGWIRDDGPRLFEADPGRLVVSGGSAGGYLTMTSGFRVDPPPTALVTYWGYGALDNDWYAEPSEFYRSVAPLVSEEEAYGDGNLYLYLRQNGLWTNVVAGFDPHTERDELDPYTPVRNVTPEYPPILMVHGTNDNDVPYTESAEMSEELARHDVAHELILVPDGNHGLGTAADPALITDAHNRAVAFIHRHLAGETRSGEIEPLLAAFSAIDDGQALAREGEIAKAKQAYTEALHLEPRLTVTAWMWNTLCRNGSLSGYAADVMFACDRAVDLASGPNQAAWTRDGRAIARALTGDVEGAVDDLEAFLSAGVGNDEFRARRQDWVATLRAGNNPYSETVLDSLRDS